MPAARKKKIRAILTFVTFAALILLLIGLRSRIFDTLSNLKDANAFALMLIIVWQSLNFHSQANLYKSFFRILNEDVSYKFALRTALEMNFVNAVLPSGGVSGFSYFGIKLKNHGVSPGKATLVLMMRFIFIFISFEIFLVTGLLILAIGGRANDVTILFAGVLTTLILILTIGLTFIIGSKKRIDAFFTFITRAVNRAIHLFRRRHPETINILRAKELFSELHDNYIILRANPKALKDPFIFAFNANLAEVLTIFTVFVAIGEYINPGAIIIAYAVANFAGLISVLPSGVGVYEALMTAVLATAGVSPAISLPAIITYRVINFLIQLPPGYVLYYRSMHPKR